MPRELITIQVGQCGNQIGARFWDLALREHAKNNKGKVYDDALSSFFRNVDKGENGPINLKVGSDIRNLKARAIVVDMEEGVINQILKSDIGEIFDERQFIHDVSGAGNNWAHGHFFYGNKYKNLLLERIRKTAEQCDSLQCFFMFHSLGGGTGSGVGTYLLGLLEDNYPEIFRFTASVFPQKDDDVVTSPYNSILALNELCKHADCVFPIDNQALMNICFQIDNPTKAKLVKENMPQTKEELDLVMNKGSKITETGQATKNERPFDKMNNIIAHLLSNITCSMRFDGVLNVDLNEITMNLVPYPDLHFLISSMAPLYSLSDAKLQPRRLDQMFKDCYHKDFQLINCNPIQHKYLAVGLIARGEVSFSDMNRNIKTLKKDLDMIYWNSEGFKYGICNTAPIGQPYSLLCLANNTAIKGNFEEIYDRFSKLYKRKVYVHHYTEYMEQQHFEDTKQNILNLVKRYDEMENVQPKKQKRLIPII